MTDKECKGCKKYDDCNGKAWYDVFEIKWCPYQVQWIILHLEKIMSGGWPDEVISDEEEKRRPKAPSAPELPKDKKSRRYGNAHWTRYCEVAAELEVRLNETGKDGDYVRTRYSKLWYNKDLDEFAREVNVPQVESRIERAMYYITGRDRKDKTYAEFCEAWKEE